jgi:DNA invertase Pin-like site-specific DNA recombinase
MTTTSTERTMYVPIDERDPATVRALILARTSNPSGTQEDVESQVDQCYAFIQKMGWHLIHPDDHYAYAEMKTGMRQVLRPVLKEVLRMAQQDKVDVIVCLKLSRIDRKAPRRYYVMQVAADYGVEFRFVNHPETRGKLPEGEVAELKRFIEDMYDEREAREIVARLSPGKRKRYEQGLPHGGRGGALYGYADGVRRYKGEHEGRQGRPLGLLTWVIDEAKADWVRWLFKTADETTIHDFSLRGLARDLETRGAPTATVGAHWSAKQVYNVLRNGKYGGKGENLRYEVTWGKYTNSATHEVFDNFQVRMREGGTFPVPLSAVPAIVDAAVWERVQEKLDHLRDQHNRGGPRRTDAIAHSTLLDGYIRCAHCGGKMTRYWGSRAKYPFYQCMKRSGTPFHPCKPHQIAAPTTDAFALRLLAKVLTDPEKILELAGAAETQLAKAEGDVSLTAARLRAYETRLDAIMADQDKLRTALKALSTVPGMEGAIADTRARLDALDQDYDATAAERDALVPAQSHANARADFLRSLFTTRDVVLNFTLPYTNEEVGEPYLAIGSQGVRAGPNGERLPHGHLSLPQAAAPLGVTEADLEDLDLPIEPGHQIRVQDGGTYVEDWMPAQILTSDVVCYLLERQSRERFRQILRDLEVVVKVERPRSRADWARLGPTPVAARVSLQVLGAVVVRSDVTNLSRFS